MKRQELLVAALENGTVIDHIPTEKTFQVVNLLGLENLDSPITIGVNLTSKKINRKGIIKISDKQIIFFIETKTPFIILHPVTLSSVGHR